MNDLKGWVKLTDWESGLPIYLDRTDIRVAQRLSAEVLEPMDDDEIAIELGERTRIDTRNQILLVRESCEEVLGIVPNTHQPPWNCSGSDRRTNL